MNKGKRKDRSLKMPRSGGRRWGPTILVHKQRFAARVAAHAIPRRSDRGYAPIRGLLLVLLLPVETPPFFWNSEHGRTMFAELLLTVRRSLRYRYIPRKPNSSCVYRHIHLHRIRPGRRTSLLKTCRCSLHRRNKCRMYCYTRSCLSLHQIRCRGTEVARG